MTDERIVEYLRGRGSVTAPHELVAGVADAIAELPQARQSRFGPLLPAAVAVAAAVMIVIGVLAGQPRNVGPAPESQTPAPSAVAQPGERLTTPGDVMVVPAIDDEGQWGTIRLERGEEVPRAATDGALYPVGSILIEVHVTYSADRATTGNVGAVNWRVGITGARPGVDYIDIIPRHPQRPADEVLGNFMGADGSEVIEGWIALEIPADTTGAAFLGYLPDEEAQPAREILVRDG